MQQSALVSDYKEIFKGIFVYNNPENTDQIIDELESLLTTSEDVVWLDAKIVNSDGGEYVVDKSLRSNLYFSLNLDLEYTSSSKSKINSISNLIDKSIIKSLNDYKKRFFIEVKHKDFYEVLKYRTDDHLSSHTDDNGGNKPRVSMLFYLNDDYVGGEIVFDLLNIKYFPKKGDILIFPSSYIYRHHVAKIISGVRYSVASFMS